MATRSVRLKAYTPTSTQVFSVTPSNRRARTRLISDQTVSDSMRIAPLQFQAIRQLKPDDIAAHPSRFQVIATGNFSVSTSL